MSEKFYCPLPWNAIAIRNNGDYRVCCYTNVTDQGGVLENNGVALNMGTTPADEIKNHSLLKEIRKNFLEGQWPSACQRCKTEESYNQKSGRLHALGRMKDENYFEKIVRHTKSDGAIAPEVFATEEMDLRFNNKCNLSCRSCSPTDSSGWYNDWQAFGFDQFVDRGVVTKLAKNSAGQTYALKDNYNWSENINFSDVLPKDIAGIKRIYFAGGESLLSKEHQIFLETLVSSGHSSKIAIEYNTNLSILPEAILSLWRQFESVGVGVSLDGTHAFHEYLRHPGKFSIIEKNLKKLEESSSNLHAWLACTVSILNLGHLPDFMIWKEHQKFKKIFNRADKPPISVHLAHKPLHLNLRSLPKPAKQYLSTRIHAGIEKIKVDAHFSEARKNSTYQMLNGLVDFMMSEDLSASWPEYWSRTQKLDAIRGHSFAKLEPELAQILSEQASQDYQNEQGAR